MCVGEHPISLELVYPPAGGLPAVMSLYNDGRVVIILGELAGSNAFSSTIAVCVVP